MRTGWCPFGGPVGLGLPHTRCSFYFRSPLCHLGHPQNLSRQWAKFQQSPLMEPRTDRHVRHHPGSLWRQGPHVALPTLPQAGRCLLPKSEWFPVMPVPLPFAISSPHSVAVASAPCAHPHPWHGRPCSFVASEKQQGPGVARPMARLSGQQQVDSFVKPQA